MKYKAFQQLIDTMVVNNYDYTKELDEIEKKKKALTCGTIGELGLREHTRTMIYAMLSNNRVWGPIKDNEKRIDDIFKQYDLVELKRATPESLTNEIKKIKCGNRQIKKQMLALSENIQTLERIAREHGSVDEYIRKVDLVTVVRSLSEPNGEYKLKCMGIRLVCEYLKNIGVEVVKPDTLLCRLVGRLGYSKTIPASPWEAIEICKEIGKAYNESQSFVDTVLWQYCAKKPHYFELCTEKPKCEKCLVTECKYRNNQ